VSAALGHLRPVRVVGVGLHPYQRPSDTPYTALGVHAVRAALADAGLAWTDVETAYTGTATTAMGMSRLMYRHLGATGIPMAQVENASASGSTAFRQACIDVAAGLADVAIAVGVDKPLQFSSPQRAAGVRDLVGSRVVPFTHFALLAQRYMYDHGATAEQLAMVAVKNDAIERLGLDGDRAVRVLSSVARSETVYDGENFDAALTRETAAQALGEAGVTAADLDVVELHDAFTVEELLYIEAMGISPVGRAAADLEAGQFDIGGRVAVSASGGLLAMGHPIGPTGVGQVCEITTQLRCEAGQRQHPGARTGLAHMVGVGVVCIVHVLRKG
jgi:acetyl-CoA acetyltransferase